MTTDKDDKDSNSKAIELFEEVMLKKIPPKIVGKCPNCSGSLVLLFNTIKYCDTCDYKE